VWGTDWWLGDGEKLGIRKTGSRVERNNVLDDDKDLDSILGLSLQQIIESIPLISRSAQV